MIVQVPEKNENQVLLIIYIIVISQIMESDTKSTQQQSLKSMATLRSEQSEDSLRKSDQSSSTLKSELTQFIGLLQKFKQGNLQSELSVVVSTEQEEYYSFQQKQPQDRKEMMYEAFQRCYSDACQIGHAQCRDVLQHLEKMQMIYSIHAQHTFEVEKQLSSAQEAMEKSFFLINTMKQALMDADEEITLLNEQNESKQQHVQQLQLQIRNLNQELNAEKFCQIELQSKNAQLKHLILAANMQFEALQTKLQETETELNHTVQEQAKQLKQLLQSNKSLRKQIDFKILSATQSQQQEQLATKIEEPTHSQNLPLQNWQFLNKPRKDFSPQSTARSTPLKKEWNKNTKISKC